MYGLLIVTSGRVLLKPSRASAAFPAGCLRARPSTEPHAGEAGADVRLLAELFRHVLRRSQVITAVIDPHYNYMLSTDCRSRCSGGGLLAAFTALLSRLLLCRRSIVQDHAEVVIFRFRVGQSAHR